MSQGISGNLVGGMPTSPSTYTTSGSSRPRRAQRTEGSSSSESAMGTFDISNVRYRVVTPPRPNPLISYPLDNECIDPSKVSVSITSRVFRADPSDFQTAVFIVVKEQWTPDSGSIWEAVVDEVKKYVDMMMTQSKIEPLIDISVEMVALELVRRKYLSPLAMNAKFPRLQAAWPAIKSGLFKILDKFSQTAGHLTFMTVSRLGFDRDFNNPDTVYVALDYGSPEIGCLVLEDMQSFVDEFQLDLRVHMENNELDHSAFQTLQADFTPAEIDERARNFNF